MKISKQSWHYRLMDYFDLDIPENLCKYFWTLIGIIIIAPVLLVIRKLDGSHSTVSDVKYDSIGPIIRISLFGFYIIYGIVCIYQGNLILAITLLASSGLYFGIVILCYLDIKFERKEKSTKKKEPNLVVEYIKAKKNRYCPILEFIDE